MDKPKIRKISGQKIYDCGKHFHLHINSLWWGAWKEFGWPEGTYGIGISEKLLDEAERLKRWLKLSYYKNRQYKYLITPNRFIKIAERKGGEYMARGKTRLLVIPAIELEKVPLNREDKKE